MTASEALDCLDVVKYFIEINGDKMNVMLNKLANRKSGNTQVVKR